MDNGHVCIRNHPRHTFKMNIYFELKSTHMLAIVYRSTTFFGHVFCMFTVYCKLFLHTACCFGYYHGISLVDWTRFVKTHHV